MDFKMEVSAAVPQMYTTWVQIGKMTKRRTLSKLFDTKYDFVQFEDKEIPRLLAVGRVVPLAKAAVLETISNPRNIGKPFLPPLLIARDGTVSLDGARIHRVLFLNVEVHYSGKPIDLQDVVFFNCRFVLNNAEPSRMLALEILSGDKVDFSTSA